MTGTRTASVTADCARCVPNAPLLVGVIYCEAKIALSNSLAVIAVFLLVTTGGIVRLSCPDPSVCFVPLNLNCYAYLIYIVSIVLHLYLYIYIYIYIHCTVLLLYILFCSGKYLRGSEYCTLVLSVWILGPFRYTSPPVLSALDS